MPTALTVPALIAVMTEIRDSARQMGDSANHRAHGCRNGSGGPGSDVCVCECGRRNVAAWAAFHEAIRAYNQEL